MVNLFHLIQELMADGQTYIHQEINTQILQAHQMHSPTLLTISRFCIWQCQFSSTFFTVIESNSSHLSYTPFIGSISSRKTNWGVLFHPAGQEKKKKKENRRHSLGLKTLHLSLLESKPLCISVKAGNASQTQSKNTL